MDFRDDLQRHQVLPMIMGTLLLVLLPLFRYVPWWVSVFSTLTLLIAWFVRRTLPAYLRLLLVITATIAVVLQHRALFSREAGLSLIVLMISFKLLETRKYRDAMLILAMVFFLIFSGFLLAQDLGTSIYLLLCIPFALAAVLQINQLRTHVTYFGVFRGAGRLLLLALPMMLVFYFFFPRLSVPLWVLPGSDNSSSTGFSEEISFGDISTLALNNDLAFRVDFEGELPSEEQRYWRTIMLTEFDGYTWRAHERNFQKEKLTTDGTEYHYSVTMQPHQGRWLPVLDVPIDASAPGTLTAGRMLWLGYQLRTVLNYRAVSKRSNQFGETLDDRDRQSYLQLPSGGNPLSHAYGQRLRARFDNNETIARALLQQINREEFYYTLSPPVLAEDLIDDFWFNQRRGFCEHYASAVVFILRAADVPSRVIGGYQGGKVNPFGGYLTVLQSNAHAWVEYWHEQRGWQRLDPTAAILPSRIEPDLRQQLRARDGIFEPAQWASTVLDSAALGLLQELQQGWQLANQWFDSNIVRFNKEMQRDWLNQAGLTSVERDDLIQILVVGVFLGLAIAGWILLRTGRAHEPLVRCYQQFESKMQKRGVVRQLGEPPLQYFLRCQQQAPSQSQTVALFSRCYLAMRFGEAPTDIPALKKLLRQLR